MFLSAYVITFLLNFFLGSFTIILVVLVFITVSAIVKIEFLGSYAATLLAAAAAITALGDLFAGTGFSFVLALIFGLTIVLMTGWSAVAVLKARAEGDG